MTPQPDWAEHAVTIVVAAGVIIGLLLTLLTSLARQGLNQLLVAIKKLDDTIEKLFDKFDDHEHRLSALEGEHKARVRLRTSCRVVGSDEDS